MITTSEFRTLFWARKIFVFLFVLLISSVFLIAPIEGNILIFSVLVTLSLTYQFIKLSNLYRIIISEKGINTISFLTKKQEFVSFNEIEKFDLVHVKGKRSSVYGSGSEITKGFYESNIILKNNKSILITPDLFENYRELIKSLSENFTKFNSEKNASHKSNLKNNNSNF